MMMFFPLFLFVPPHTQIFHMSIQKQSFFQSFVRKAANQDFVVLYLFLFSLTIDGRIIDVSASQPAIPKTTS